VTDTVQNQGDAAAVASNNRYYLSLNATYDSSDNRLTGTRSVPALAAGASSSGTIPVTIPTTTAAGTYYLLTCVDGGGAVAETNEINNCRASSTTVQVTN
jgi:subtilase family serine protease